MAIPTLTPESQLVAVALPSASSDTAAQVIDALPHKIYTSQEFVTGALTQVAFTFVKLGGNVLDIELKKEDVYANYEEACSEYSYLVNLHQAKNALPSLLGNTTASFDHKGEVEAGGPEGIELKLPRIRFEYAERVADAVETKIGIGGSQTIYSASFDTEVNKQDYDLQTIVSSSAASDSTLPYSDANLGTGKVGNKKIEIKRVYYKTPQAMWRFFGYYGGLNVVGNMFSYGQYTDDSTFEVIPAWQNKLQAMAFEDSMKTRVSHYSYEIKNNKLRIFPATAIVQPKKMWFEFTVQEDAWEENSDRNSGVNGINNMNTLPYGNIPYENINSIGKQWIRRFALALSKGVLGKVRGKFQTLPIPGESVTLDHAVLVSESKEEQEKLREELKTILAEMTYDKLAEMDASIMESATKVHQQIPNVIYVG